MNRRGSVLVHVLVTGVIVAFIASGLLRMVLMNYIAVERAAKSSANRREAEALLNRAISYWQPPNQVCSDLLGINCAGPVGTCNCACPNQNARPRIVVSRIGGGVGGPPPCAITITSSDP